MDKLPDVVKALADALHVPAAQVWATLVRQSQVGWAPLNAVWALLGVVVLFVVRKLATKVPSSDPDIRVMSWIGTAALGLLGFWILTDNLYWALTEWFNPEYAALWWIADRLHH